MFEHILIPVDGSAPSLHAADRGAAVAKAFGSKVTVISVIDPYPFTGVSGEIPYSQAEYLESARADAEKACKDACQRLSDAGVTAESRVIESHTTWRGVLDAAGSAKADLIVMGSHGRHGIERLVMGSVTQRVLQHANVPMLIVRGE